MKLRWATTVHGTNYDEIVKAARTEVAEFFGEGWKAYWDACSIHITAEVYTQRGSGGGLIRQAIEYSADVRLEA